MFLRFIDRAMWPLFQDISNSLYRLTGRDCFFFAYVTQAVLGISTLLMLRCFGALDSRSLVISFAVPVVICYGIWIMRKKFVDGDGCNQLAENFGPFVGRSFMVINTTILVIFAARDVMHGIFEMNRIIPAVQLFCLGCMAYFVSCHPGTPDKEFNPEYREDQKL